MPAQSVQLSLPDEKKTEYRWGNVEIVKLLKIIRDNPEYTQTLFTPTNFRSKATPKWKITQELCFKMFSENRDWRGDMISLGLIRRERDRWVATEKWTSKYNDQVQGVLSRYVSHLKD